MGIDDITSLIALANREANMTPDEEERYLYAKADLDTTRRAVLVADQLEGHELFKHYSFEGMVAFFVLHPKVTREISDVILSRIHKSNP